MREMMKIERELKKKDKRMESLYGCSIHGDGVMEGFTPLGG